MKRLLLLLLAVCSVLLMVATLALWVRGRKTASLATFYLPRGMQVVGAHRARVFFLLSSICVKSDKVAETGSLSNAEVKELREATLVYVPREVSHLGFTMGISRPNPILGTSGSFAFLETPLWFWGLMAVPCPTLWLRGPQATPAPRPQYVPELRLRSSGQCRAVSGVRAGLQHCAAGGFIAFALFTVPATGGGGRRAQPLTRPPAPALRRGLP